MYNFFILRSESIKECLIGKLRLFNVSRVRFDGKLLSIIYISFLKNKENKTQQRFPLFAIQKSAFVISSEGIMYSVEIVRV